MVIRDFVNHHDHAGKHVKCLHWVMMWRDAVGEPIKRHHGPHFASHETMHNESTLLRRFGKKIKNTKQ